MREQLRFWRDLPKQTKQQLKQQHGITVVTFEIIKKVFENK